MPYETSQHSAPHGEGPHVSPLGEWDRTLHGRFARLTGGQSPWAAFQAISDWAFHLAVSPGRQVEIATALAGLTLALPEFYGAPDQSSWSIKPGSRDHRFRSPAWSRRPYNMMAQMQLGLEELWREAATGTRGVADHHARRLEFMGRFALNALSPGNFPLSNPEVLEMTQRTSGWNFVQGGLQFLDDTLRVTQGDAIRGLEGFRVGETIATTPGRVVFRNELMELIQYAPATPSVQSEPILIVPAWIMKYYILDLTPEESLVRYLVAAGFTVFIVSWRNPTRELCNTSFDDYRRLGVRAALDEVCRITASPHVHGVGYCLGGTILAIAAAAMQRDGDERLATLTLLAAQTDFTEPGELMMFIDESQLSVLEDMMRVEGYLDAHNMAAAFDALRANERVFSRLVERYYLARPALLTALDAWLADPTRMPARMHGEYLRRLLMDNAFARGELEVDGRAVAMSDVRAPVFALGAERDHIAPWRSVYKVELYGASETTFVLTGGGHNTSVVSPPGKPGAYYRVHESRAGDVFRDPDEWVADADRHEGSWWPEWLGWLRRHARGPMRKPPASRSRRGAELQAAPGSYVFQR